MATAPGYDAFISYSHALDGKLAPNLQSMVERFAKPWYRARALRVFRDTASLSANPDLWASIETALGESRWLVLLASPTAARSPYVRQETAWWLAHKSADRLLIVLTGGEFALADDDAPPTAALPPTLRPVMDPEPRWVDLRWLRDTDHVSDANPRLREAVADVAAAVRGIPKDLLVGDHIRFHRRALRLARGAVAALALLTMVAVVAAVVAFGQRDEAQAQRDNALFNQILTQTDRLASTDVSTSAELSVLGYTMKPDSPDAYTALVARGNQVRSTPLVGHDDRVRAVAYDPRSAWVASAAEDNTIRVWNPADGTAAVVSLGDGVIANSFASSPDGHVLVAAISDGTVRTWDLTDPRAPRPLGDPLRVSPQPVAAVALSPDGHILAAGAADNQVRLWDVTEPAHPRPGGAVPGFRAVTYRPDGRVLAAWDGRDAAVGLWDTTDPLHPAPIGRVVIGKPGEVVNAIAFGDEGRSMITGGTDRYAQLWNVADPAHPSVVGSFAAAGNEVTSVAVAPDASGTVAIGSLDQRITLANLTDPEQPTFLDGDGTPGAPNGFVTDVAYSPDGHRLVAGYGDGTLRLWDVPGHYSGSPAPPSSLRLSPDGDMLVAPGTDGRIRVWRRDAPAAPFVLTGHTAGVWDVAFAPDGHTLFSAGEDGTVRMWDLAAPQTPPRTVVSGQAPIQDVAVSADGRTLAVSGASVQLWDLADPRLPPRTLVQRTAAALTVAFSPDGHRLAAGYADNAIDLWDLNRPTDPPHPLDGHRSSVLDLTFSPDGRHLASTGSDFTVRLWDVTDPARPTPPAVVLRGHTDTVRAVVFSRDGRRLATGGNDHTVRLWNLDDPARPTAFGGPLRLGPAFGTASVVTGVAFAPDGDSIAIASSDETVRIWDLDAAALVRRICATAAHNLTEAAWRESFRDQPYPGAPCR